MKKICIFALLFVIGTASFAQERLTTNPEQRSNRERRVVDSNGSNRAHNGSTPDYLGSSKRGANYFNISIVGQFSDMLNNMFKSSASLEGAWIYAFEKYVFLELGITYQVVSPNFNDTYVTAGVGFQATRYYQPEIILESQFIGGYNLRMAIRNNIIVPSGPVVTRVFIDVGGAYLQSSTGDQPHDKSWTYYLGLGVGLLI